MEAAIVEMEDLKEIIEDKFNDKLNPIIRAIERLEKSQESIVGLMRDLAVTTAEVRNLEEKFRAAIEDNVRIHDTLFNRTRENSDKISAIQKELGNKLWDILKLIIVAIFSFVVAWLAKG